MASTLRRYCLRGIEGQNTAASSYAAVHGYPYQEAGKNTVEHERSTKDPLTIYSEVFQTSPTDIAAPAQYPALVVREESTAQANVVSFNVAMLPEAMTRLNSCSCMLQSPAREEGQHWLARFSMDSRSTQADRFLLHGATLNFVKHGSRSYIAVSLRHNISQLHENL